MLREWGIVRGNAPYLFEEKVKAYLRCGARKLPGFDQWPNNQVGMGRCVCGIVCRCKKESGRGLLCVGLLN